MRGNRWRRGALGAATLGVGVALAAGATAPAATLYAASLRDGSLTGFVGPLAKGTLYQDGLSVVGLDQPRDLAVSPDGRTVYAITGSGMTRVNTTTGATETIAVQAGASSHVALTPDGATALVTDATSGELTPIDTATDRPGPAIAVRADGDLAVTPDGTTAWVGAKDRQLTPITLATRAVGPSIPLAHPAAQIAMTPDGSLAIVTETNDDLQVIHLASRVSEPPVTVAGSPPTALTLTSDGKTAYIADAGTSIFPFDVVSRQVGEPLRTLAPVAGVDVSAGDLAVTPDGSHLLGTIACDDGRCGGELFAFSFDTPYNPPPGGNAQGTTTKANFPVATAPSAVALAPEPSVSISDRAGNGLAHTLFAFASDDGGTTTAYTWSFGDGSSGTTTTSPSVDHVFPASGTYTVALRTTNSGGCAARVAFTGQALACTGQATAATTRTVTVAPQSRPTRPGGPGAGGGATKVTGTFALRSSSLRLFGRRTRIAVRCASSVACHGRLTLSTRARGGRRHRLGGCLTTLATPCRRVLRQPLRAIGCGHATVALRAGGSGSATMTIAARCRSLLRRSAHQRLSTTLTSRMTTGQPVTTRTMRLTRSRPRGR